MVKIRLMRIGTKKRPFYRIVAVDERKKRTGSYIENLGTYNPLTEPKEIIIKQDRVDEWIKKGAVLSDGFLRIIGKAPQRPPRKPKKEAKAPESASIPASSNEKPTEEVPTESDSAPVQETVTSPVEEPQPLQAMPVDTQTESETNSNEVEADGKLSESKDANNSDKIDEPDKLVK